MLLLSYQNCFYCASISNQNRSYCTDILICRTEIVPTGIIVLTEIVPTGLINSSYKNCSLTVITLTVGVCFYYKKSIHRHYDCF